MQDDAPDQTTPSPTGRMRIARFLARGGVASRRHAEELVLAGRVALNGETVRDLGRQVVIASDLVTVDGDPVTLPPDSLTLLFNKPMGCVVTRSDDRERTTIYDLLPAPYQALASALVYAGRLDYDTSGLIVLSTDGDLVNVLSHPSSGVPKTYLAEVTPALRPAALDELVKGVELSDGPARARAARAVPGGARQWVELVVEEGRNRIVRRLIEAVGGRVTALRRTAIGDLKLDELELEEGDWREMDGAELLRRTGKG